MKSCVLIETKRSLYEIDVDNLDLGPTFPLKLKCDTITAHPSFTSNGDVINLATDVGHSFIYFAGLGHLKHRSYFLYWGNMLQDNELIDSLCRKVNRGFYKIAFQAIAFSDVDEPAVKC